MKSKGINMMNCVRALMIFHIALMIYFPRYDLYASDITVDKRDNLLTIENKVIRRIISFNDNKIIPVSLYLVSKERELLAQADTVIWFELHVNNTLITNVHAIWEYQDHTTKALDNGGTEVRITVRTKDERLSGLELILRLQMFPGVELIREHLELRSAANTELNLTYTDGYVHIVFPRYEFAGNSLLSEVEEIRIASWNHNEFVNDRMSSLSYDETSDEEGWRIGRNLGKNYMYHPRFIPRKQEIGEVQSLKGPFVMQHDPGAKLGWFIAYEHGSPDDDIEQEYIVIDMSVKPSSTIFAVRYKNGCYFNNERISEDHPFRLNWSTVGVFSGDSSEEGYKKIWRYLHTWITEHPDSRNPLVYYNTWGMQRDEQAKGADPRGILTLNRVLGELSDADKLGIDLFVLDDGWQENFGDWYPHPERYPDGLQALKDALLQKDITFGLWLAVLAADSFATVVNDHPDWLIRDDNGLPVVGRWDKYVNCFVSDYQTHFLEVSKRLIDSGVRYFKWDGIDKHLCDSPHHHHGDERQTAEERKIRYGYELIRYITETARRLREYHRDVIVEFDVTEPGRSVGLSFLSEGRYFWMNNGASWYGDRSQYRAKSMRHIPNLFGKIIPTVLMTHANYPHNHPIYFAQRYSINSSYLGGLGFWGNLSDMTDKELNTVGNYTRRAKLVYKTVAATTPEIIGSVGSSPEIYTHLDRTRGIGQVIVFSGSANQFKHRITDVRADQILAVLQNAYKIDKDTLQLCFSLPMADVSREAIIIPNNGNGVSITESTSWIKSVEISDDTLSITNGDTGRYVIMWAKRRGEPVVYGDDSIKYDITISDDESFYNIIVDTSKPNSMVRVSGD